MDKRIIGIWILLIQFVLAILKLCEKEMGHWRCEECDGRGTHESILVRLVFFFRKPRRCNRCHGTGRMQPPLSGPPKVLPNPPPKRRHND